MRQLLTLVDNLLGEIPITFYEDRFEIKHACILDENTGKKIVIYFKPNMDFILKYETNKEYFAKNKKCTFTPSVKNFTKYITSTAKKDALEFYAFVDKPDTLCANISKSGSWGRGGSTFKNTNIDLFDIETASTDRVKPNITVPLSDITNLCSSINKAKTSYKGIEFLGYKKGMRLVGNGHTDEATLGDKWGNCNDEDYIGSYKMTLDKNKALSVIHNITETGVVAVFFDKTSIKLKLPTGSYGETDIIFDNGVDVVKSDESGDDAVSSDAELVDDKDDEESDADDGSCDAINDTTSGFWSD